MTLKEFMQSANGRKLAPLFSDADVVQRMEAMTALGRPAVKAIDADVAAAVGSLDNVEKQHVGRWERDTLVRRGLKPIRQLDWRGGKVFSSGAVYGSMVPLMLAERSENGAPGAIDLARALLLAGRIDLAKPVDTVENFLADRRANWADA